MSKKANYMYLPVADLEIDLRNDTITPETVLQGFIGHNAKGEQFVGTAQGGGGDGSISLNTFINNGGKCAMYEGSSLDLTGVDTSDLTSFDDLFNNDQLLLSLDVSDFNTSSATSMVATFAYCSGLTTLNVSNFVTTNVTNMHNMFGGCMSLTSLNLSNFSTANVTRMSSMFTECSSLTSLTLSNFNTANVTNMESMFSGCSSLTSLNLSNFDTSNVTSFSNMFGMCENLASLDIRNFDLSASDTGKGYEIWGMFDGVPSNCVIYVNQATATILTNDFNTDNASGLASLSMLNVVS